MTKLEEGKSTPKGVRKFVRVNQEVAVGEPVGGDKTLKDHSAIAIDDGLVESQDGKPSVDDAGYLRHVSDDVITVAESTSSCNLDWVNFRENRLQTVAILETLTGLTVEDE